MFPQAPGALSAAQAPQANAMQPLGAPGTPASLQAMPYGYFPAPRIGPAAAGAPARPISPMIQSTGMQIGDALSAAGAPAQPMQGTGGKAGFTDTPAPQQPQQQQPMHQQQPSPWVQAAQGAMGQAGGNPMLAMQSFMPQGMPQMGGFINAGFGNQQPPEQASRRFWGGFNWNGQPGQSPVHAPIMPRNRVGWRSAGDSPAMSQGFSASDPSTPNQGFAVGEPYGVPEQNFRPIMGGGGWS